MLSKNLKAFRYAGMLLAVAAFCSVLVYPFLRGESAPPSTDDLQKQMEAVKTEIEIKGDTPELTRQYNSIANILSKCGVINDVTEPTIRAPFAPAASLCINGSIAGTDPSWQRPATQSTGSGLQCPTLTTGGLREYDFYSFNLTGCTVFPTEVTVTTCGPAGCLPTGNTDSTVFLYRNVAAGDPLTANGGLPAVFNPASPCTNARAAQDDLGTVAGTTNNPGGSTCNQVVGANCVGPCTTAGGGAVSGFRRQIGSGRFTVVVSGFGDTTTGNYNLYVNVPAAGCALSLAPSAANATIGGQVRTQGGQGIAKATVTISGEGIGTMTARTNGFGYYSFGDLPTGTYVLSINGTKMYSFAAPTRAVTLEDNISDADFVSEQ